MINYFRNQAGDIIVPRSVAISDRTTLRFRFGGAAAVMVDEIFDGRGAAVESSSSARYASMADVYQAAV